MLFATNCWYWRCAQTVSHVAKLLNLQSNIKTAWICHWQFFCVVLESVMFAQGTFAFLFCNASALARPVLMEPFISYAFWHCHRLTDTPHPYWFGICKAEMLIWELRNGSLSRWEERNSKKLIRSGFQRTPTLLTFRVNMIFPEVIEPRVRFVPLIVTFWTCRSQREFYQYFGV